MPLPITSVADYRLLDCNKYVPILFKIIFDDLTELARELLQHSIAHSQVIDYYKTVKQQYRTLFTKREEEIIINAARTGYEYLDITIIAKLLRHVPENIHFETHVSSLTRIRNYLCHLPSTYIAKSQFDIYFNECCNIASALEEYLKKPKLLVQNFQIIYEVNTRSKEDRIDLHIEEIKRSLTELKTSGDRIHNEELEFLEECICQIDTQIDDRKRQVVNLKEYAQEVKNKLEYPKQAKWFLTAQGDKLDIESNSLKYREEETKDKTRRDPVSDTANIFYLRTKVEREGCEGQMHFFPSSRLEPHLESLKACEYHGFRNCTESNSSVIGTFEHSVDFPTIKSKSWDRRSLNRLDPSVVHLRSEANDSCKLGHSSFSYVGITENNSILVSQSPSVDTVSQLSVKEEGAYRSQGQSQDDTLLTINKEHDHGIKNLTNIQIKIGDSLAKPHTHEGKELPKFMTKYHKEYLSKPATERQNTVAPEQRKAELPSGYSLPSKKTIANSDSAVVVPKSVKKQYLHRQSSKLHSCKTISEVSMMAKRLSGFPLKDRNRKRKKRKERKDRLSDLGVDWRMDVKELNKEFEDEISTDVDSYHRTAVVLYTDEDHENAENFQRVLNLRIPDVKIELQDEVCLPGKNLFDVSPYFTRHYIFVLLSQYYQGSIVKHKASACLCEALKDKNKYGRVIPVLMKKEDELPDEFLPIEPVEYYDENSMEKLLLLFKPNLNRSMSY